MPVHKPRGRDEILAEFVQAGPEPAMRVAISPHTNEKVCDKIAAAVR
jgi:hypothetical protein